MARCTTRCSGCSRGEDVDAVARDEHRVLELRRGLTVEGGDRPAVVPLHDVGATERQHRLDGEDGARPQPAAIARLVVVMDVRGRVELLTDAVTDELLHDAEAGTVGDRLDRSTDVAHPAT